MKIFTCTDGEGRQQTYEGFSKPFVKTMSFPLVMALVTYQGEMDYWAIEDDREQTTHVCEELERYYRSEYGVEEIRIAIFDRRLIMETDDEI